MLSMLLAILCSSAISVIMKVSDRRGQSGYAILCVNYLFAAIVSLVLALCSGAPTGMTPAVWMLGLVAGVVYLAAFILNQYSICHNGAVLSAVFMKIGILVPILLSMVLWGERPSLLQSAGMVLAVAAILIMTLQKGEADGSRRQVLWVLPLLLLCAGTADGMSKFYTVYGVERLNAWYVFLTFCTAFLLCFPLMRRKGEHFNREKLGLGALLGVTNYGSTWFLLLALGKLPTYLAYPVVNTGAIAVVTVVSVLAFRERLKKRQLLGLGLVLIAVVLLNL